MTINNKIKIISEELLPFYPYASMEDLIEVANRAAKEAEEIYKNLPEPKTCDLDAYINYSIQDEIISDIELNFIKRNDHKKKINSYESSFKKHIEAHSKYYETIGLDDPSNPEREKPTMHEIWDEIDKQLKLQSETQILSSVRPMINDLEQKYLGIVDGFSALSKSQGFDSKVEFNLNSERIPMDDYTFFLNNAEKVIDYCKNILPRVSLPDWYYSQFNYGYKHSLLSFLPDFPELRFPEGVIDFASEHYPILNKYRPKIKVHLVNGASSSRYLKNEDSFWIGINKNYDYRTRIVVLIHELGHVISNLLDLKLNNITRSKGNHIAEKKAYIVEYSLLKKLSIDVYGAEMAIVLNGLVDAKFLIETYSNPKQDLPKLYAGLFNHSFPGSHQPDNYTYLLKENTVFYPFRNLKHSIAQIKVLSEMIEQDNSS